MLNKDEVGEFKKHFQSLGGFSIEQNDTFCLNPISTAKIITFLSSCGDKRIVVDLDAGKIELFGDWDDNARLFIKACKNILGQKVD